jgi:hypothetical protein
VFDGCAARPPRLDWPAHAARHDPAPGALVHVSLSTKRRRPTRATSCVRLLAHRHRHQRPATRQPLASRKLATIEGNTNGKGERERERDSVTGDGVWVKERVPTLAKSYIRIFS